MSTAAADPVVDSTVKESAHESAHDVALTPFTIFRYVASIALLIFSIVIVGALMFTGNTRVAKETNPWVALIVCVSINICVQCVRNSVSSIYNFVHMICSHYILFFLIFHTTITDPRCCLAFND